MTVQALVGGALGEEAGEFVSNVVRLADDEMPAGFEAEEAGVRDTAGGPLGGVVGDKRIVFGVDEQGWHLDRLQLVAVDVRVGDEGVIRHAHGADREEAVDELGNEVGLVTAHREPPWDARQERHSRWGAHLDRPHRELSVHQPGPGGLDDGGRATRKVARQHNQVPYPLRVPEGQLKYGTRR
jgi:hypothetical protein